MSTGKFLIGFTVGVAIGAIAGILLAPKSGEETREMISETTKEAIRKTDETVKHIQEKAEDIVCEMQQKGDEIMGNIQHFINEKKESFRKE